jgi:hypothetical protein
MTIGPVLAVALLAANAGPRKIAVMDLEGSNVDPALAQSASLVLPTELRGRLPGVQVISSGEIKSMLGLEKTKQALGCEDEGCMAEIGGALGVDELISGKLGKVGRTFVVELRRTDVRAARTLASAVRTVQGQEDALIAGLQEMAGELYPGTVSAGKVKAIEARSEGWEPGFLSNRAAAWIGAGLGAAALIGGGVVAKQAWDVGQDYKAQQDLPATAATVTRADASTAKTKYTVGWSLVGAGALIGGWGTYRIFHLRGQAGVAVVPIPGGGAVSMGGSF